MILSRIIKENIDILILFVVGGLYSKMILTFQYSNLVDFIFQFVEQFSWNFAIAVCGIYLGKISNIKIKGNATHIQLFALVTGIVMGGFVFQKSFIFVESLLLCLPILTASQCLSTRK